MTANPYLIIIPAYNEGDNIGPVLQQLLQLRLKADILVVNDGSLDHTEEIARKYGVFVISHPTNLGYVASLQTGYRFAAERDYPYIIQFDGDGQHDARHLQNIMKTFQEKNVDIVIGSRFLGKSEMKIGFFKKLAILFFRGLIGILTGKKITDPTSGLRGFNKRVYSAFTHSDRFTSEYPDSNFLIELILNEYQIIEVPVNMKDRINGTGMHSGIKPVLYIVQVILSILIVLLRHKLKKWVKV